VDNETALQSWRNGCATAPFGDLTDHPGHRAVRVAGRPIISDPEWDQRDPRPGVRARRDAALQSGRARVTGLAHQDSTTASEEGTSETSDDPPADRARGKRTKRTSGLRSQVQQHDSQCWVDHSGQAGRRGDRETTEGDP